MDKNGYNPSIMQADLNVCYMWPSPYCCGGKLDRHEVFGGAHRSKSKEKGLWIMLCHNTCHTGPNGVHSNSAMMSMLREDAQKKAMKKYGWSEDDFIDQFGKSYLK